MSRDDDDDALSWGGDRGDPSHAASPETPVTPAASPSAPTTGSALLIAYGIFGGVYLLYSIGWIIGVQRDGYTSANLFFEIMYQFGEFLAIASSALWLVLTLVLTRGRKPVIRVALLVLGILLLVPWPFVLSGSTP